MLPTMSTTRAILPLLATVCCAALPLAARAQSGQEKIVQEKLERSGTLEYLPAGKAFSADAAVGSRGASVRAFSFGGRTANAKSGDGAFQARKFNDGRGTFRAESYAVKQASAVNRQAIPADSAFATRSVDVREDRAANRSLDTSRPYINTAKPFLVQGKRQDILDDQQKRKNLTIDQVRELLNKNR